LRMGGIMDIPSCPELCSSLPSSKKFKFDQMECWIRV
jgi:hypothetical protein